MAKAKLIIDTDPGIDDILGLLLALSWAPEDAEVCLISLTFGNVEVQSCLRNVVSMLHIIQREMDWRKKHGKPAGFDVLRARKPIIAVGAEHPLDDQKMLADYFRKCQFSGSQLSVLCGRQALTIKDGKDGLGGIHSTHPHLTPSETWEHLFDPSTDGNIIEPVPEGDDRLFIASKRRAHEEILRILRENDPGTVTIVALGPLTNLALAAAEDVETFLRVKEVAVMGGAVNQPGNVTPVGEFNVYADAVAAARVFALTSPNPATTLPPSRKLSPYPDGLSKRLALRLFPLDITHRHTISRGEFERTVKPLLEAGSPLAEWVAAFMSHVFLTVERLHSGPGGDKTVMELHDPAVVWYGLTADDPRWTPTATSPEDIRIESFAQWTRGMCVVDRRNRRVTSEVQESHSDHGLWLSRHSGNRIVRMDGSPGPADLGKIILQRVFGLE